MISGIKAFTWRRRVQVAPSNNSLTRATQTDGSSSNCKVICSPRAGAKVETMPPHAESASNHLLLAPRPCVEILPASFRSLEAGPLTQKNLSDLKAAFSVFDQNDDGFISQEELLGAMLNFGHIVSKDDVKEMIRLVDKDGNGLVDFKEFLNLMESNSIVQNIDQEMQNLFSCIDRNGDGYITEKELKDMLKGLGEKVSKKDIKRMMKVADQNKDGKISFSEFKKFVGSTGFIGGPGK